MTRNQKSQIYQKTIEHIGLLIEPPCDWIAAMATVSCELNGAFDYYDWVGFYRTIRPDLLHVGPYQGGHGCLLIPYDRGVCGAAARTRSTQIVDDVRDFPGHIDCSSTTRSEIVVPVFGPSGIVIAVLDVDSDSLSAFGEPDVTCLEDLCRTLGDRFGAEAERSIGDL